MSISPTVVTDIITKTIMKQGEYDAVKVQAAIEEALRNLDITVANNALVLPTVDSGLANAIWIDTPAQSEE